MKEVINYFINIGQIDGAVNLLKGLTLWSIMLLFALFLCYSFGKRILDAFLKIKERNSIIRINIIEKVIPCFQNIGLSFTKYNALIEKYSDFIYENKEFENIKEEIKEIDLVLFENIYKVSVFLPEYFRNYLRQLRLITCSHLESPLVVRNIIINDIDNEELNLVYRKFNSHVALEDILLRVNTINKAYLKSLLDLLNLYINLKLTERTFVKYLKLNNLTDKLDLIEQENFDYLIFDNIIKNKVYRKIEQEYSKKKFIKLKRLFKKK